MSTELGTIICYGAICNEEKEVYRLEVMFANIMDYNLEYISIRFYYNICENFLHSYILR